MPGLGSFSESPEAGRSTAPRRGPSEPPHAPAAASGRPCPQRGGSRRARGRGERRGLGSRGRGAAVASAVRARLHPGERLLHHLKGIGLAGGGGSSQPRPPRGRISRAARAPRALWARGGAAAPGGRCAPCPVRRTGVSKGLALAVPVPPAFTPPLHPPKPPRNNSPPPRWCDKRKRAFTRKICKQARCTCPEFLLKGEFPL